LKFQENWKSQFDSRQPIKPSLRARARALFLPDRRAPPVGANLSALSPSLSRCSVGPVYRHRCSRACPLPLSAPTDPTCQHVPNLLPTISPSWTRSRPRVLRPRPILRGPFEPRALLAHIPSSISALCPTLSISLSRSAHANRERPPPPADVHRLFHGRRCVRAPSSATVSLAFPSTSRDTLRCAPSLPGSAGPRSPEWFLRSWCSATVVPSRPCASAAARASSVPPQGEQPPRAPISPYTALVSAQLLTGVAPRRR
jgi:hypothetical protein